MYINPKNFESFMTHYAYAKSFAWWSLTGHETKQDMQLN